MSDPDLCSKTNGKVSGLSTGLSVTFWFRMTASDRNIDSGLVGKSNSQNHQYIASSGGQISNSRGFSILYAVDEKRYKIQIQSMNYAYLVEVAEDSVGDDWVHFAFTWKEEGTLIIALPFNKRQGFSDAFKACFISMKIKNKNRIPF